MNNIHDERICHVRQCQFFGQLTFSMHSKTNPTNAIFFTTRTLTNEWNASLLLSYSSCT